MACQPIRGIRSIGIPKACTDESRLFGNRWLPQTNAGCSGGSLPPSPPAEKATARQDQAGQSSTNDGSRRLALRIDDCAPSPLQVISHARRLIPALVAVQAGERERVMRPSSSG